MANLSTPQSGCLDDRILSEYRDVLGRPAFGFRRRDIAELLDFLESVTTVLPRAPCPSVFRELMEV